MISPERLRRLVQTSEPFYISFVVCRVHTSAVSSLRLSSAPFEVFATIIISASSASFLLTLAPLFPQHPLILTMSYRSAVNKISLVPSSSESALTGSILPELLLDVPVL